MAKRDYYKILGISRNATADQIKRAYRNLAKKYHPDHNPNNKNAENKFKEIREAYDVLSNDEQRKIYDQFGHAGMGAGAAPGGGWRSGPRGQRVYTWKSTGGPDIPFDNLDDLFEIFGGGAANQRKSSIFDEFMRGAGHRAHPGPGTAQAGRGQDIEHPVSLTFEQAINGTKLEITLSPPSGRGGTKKIEVKIPPGVGDGQKIRLRGKGQPGNPPGDLHIVCKVKPHRYFRRVGNDIYLDLPISVSEAALGTKVEIPTLEGKSVLTVPPGTASGTKLRLKNKGVKPANHKSRGDQYAVIRIVPPKILTPEQRQIFEKLSTIQDDSPRKDINW